MELSKSHIFNLLAFCISLPVVAARTYDAIGNRVTSSLYDEQGEAQTSRYVANALNQYESRTVPGNVQVHGEADAAAVVTVNENPTWRSGEYFYGGDYADNTRTATNKQVEIVAVLPAAAPGGEDEISAVTGRVFVAKTPEVFTYDADGNMTSDGRFAYTWNAENRMVSASNAEVVVTYAYDHKGRMIRKTISRGDAEPQSITYLWDGWNIIREVVREGDSVAVADNLWGLDLDGTMQGAGGVGGLLAVIRDGETYIPTYDANGNVSEYLFASDGSVAAHYDYSPFGETLVASGTLAATFTHRFSTKLWCGESALYYYGYRFYSPMLGRWITRDPIEEGGGRNLYGFCENDAVLVYDYIGLMVDIKDQNFNGVDENTLTRLRSEMNSKSYEDAKIRGVFLIKDEDFRGISASEVKVELFKIVCPNPSVEFHYKIAWLKNDAFAECHENRHLDSNIDNLEQYDFEVQKYHNKTVCGINEATKVISYLESFREYIIQKSIVDDNRIDFEDYPPELSVEANFRYMSSYDKLFMLEAAMQKSKRELKHAY